MTKCALIICFCATLFLSLSVVPPTTDAYRRRYESSEQQFAASVYQKELARTGDACIALLRAFNATYPDAKWPLEGTNKIEVEKDLLQWVLTRGYTPFSEKWMRGLYNHACPQLT